METEESTGALDDLLGGENVQGNGGSDPKDVQRVANLTQRASKSLKKQAAAEKTMAKIIDKLSNVGMPAAMPKDPMRDRAVQEVVPPRDKIRVYRRDETGKLVLINDYTTNEIALDGDVAAFINKQLRPTYGDFDYPIFLLDALGNEIPHSTVPRRAPKQEAAASDGASTVQILRTMVDAIREERTAGEAHRQPEHKSSTLDEMTQLLQLVTSQQNQKVDPFMLMAMPMLRDAFKSAPQHEAPSQMNLVIGKVLDRMESIEAEMKHREVQTFPALPPPMAPEPAQPALDVAALVSALSAAMKPSEPAAKPLGVQDMIQLMAAMQPQQPQKQGLDLLQIATVLPSIVGSIRSMLGIDTMQQQMQLLVQNQSQTPKGSLSDEIQRTGQVIQAARLLAGSGSAQSPSDWMEFLTHAVDLVPDVLDRATKFMHARNAEKKHAAKPQKEEETSTSTAEEPEEPQQAIELSQEARESVERMASTEDGDEILSHAFGFIRSVAKATGWRKYVNLIVLLSKQGKGDKVLNVFRGILEALVKGDIIDVEAGQRIYIALEERIDTIIEAIKGN